MSDDPRRLSIRRLFIIVLALVSAFCIFLGSLALFSGLSSTNNSPITTDLQDRTALNLSNHSLIIYAVVLFLVAAALLVLSALIWRSFRSSKLSSTRASPPPA
jgi:hypothetical protein